MTPAQVLSKAISISAEKHDGQLDKGGNPYILHPMRMMMRLRTSDMLRMAICMLHDVIEDCGMTFDELRKEGMPERVIDGVRALTRMPGQSYEQFIEGLAGNLDALLVKREDLRDNSDLTRLKGLTDKDFARAQKYMRAFKRVEELIANLTAAES